MHLDPLFLALICGHFLGDFIFQPDFIVERKAKHVQWMLYHVMTVAALTWVLLGDLGAWWIAGLVILFHWPVDSLKVWIARTKQRWVAFDDQYASAACAQKGENDAHWLAILVNDSFLFVADQALHIITVVAIWFCLEMSGYSQANTNFWSNLWGLSYARGLLLLTGLAVGVWGVGIVLKYQMEGFAAELSEDVQQGLPKGGKTIGILERLLVFMFVLAGKPEGVGFVLAAKSVFRIGELTNKHERNQAEYIMIGSLRSFTYALLVAFITQWLIGWIR